MSIIASRSSRAWVHSDSSKVLVTLMKRPRRGVTTSPSRSASCWGSSADPAALNRDAMLASPPGQECEESRRLRHQRLIDADARRMHERVHSCTNSDTAQTQPSEDIFETKALASPEPSNTLSRSTGMFLKQTNTQRSERAPLRSTLEHYTHIERPRVDRAQRS